MIKHIKYLALISILLTSVACTLPFLAGAAEVPEPADMSTPVPPTPVRTTPVPATPEEPAVAGGVDPCLTGLWTMDTFALNNKFLDLTHSPTMFVVAPSAMTLEFRADGTYSINGETTIRSDMGTSGDYMQLPGTHVGQGSYSADGSTIVMTNAAYSVTFGTMLITINGETAESPVNSLTFPDNFMAPPPSTAYQCSSSLLQITYDGPSGPVTEEWNR